MPFGTRGQEHSAIVEKSAEVALSSLLERIVGRQPRTAVAASVACTKKHESSILSLGRASAYLLIHLVLYYASVLLLVP